MQLPLFKALANSPVLSSQRMPAAAGWQNILLTSLVYLVFVLIIYGIFCLGALIAKASGKK